MVERHDVVIAGAGPAGGQCARDLGARGYDVLVLETETESEFPRQSNKSTAGTFPRMMAQFNVPNDVVQHFTDKVVLESPNDAFVQHQAGAVLDFGLFKQWLVEESRANGAEYRWEARATAPIVEDDTVVGVTYNGDEEVYADVVIDATGPSAPLARKLGISNLERENQAIGIEFEYEGVEPDHPDFADTTDAMMLRLDHDLAPGGYAWLFHTGADTAKVGLCYIQNDSYRMHANGSRTVDEYLEHWLETDPRFENATRREDKQTHRGSAHVQPPGRMSMAGFMAIGDTVPTIDPLWGEGIDKCMRSGRAAAVVADSALTHTEPDVSAALMRRYDEMWHDWVAPKAKARLAMTRLLYLASNERYDRLMGDMRSLDTDTLANINNGNRLAMRKLIHLSDLPLLWRYLRLHGI